MKRSPLYAACALFVTGIVTNAAAQQTPEGEKKTQAMEAVIVTGTKVQDRTVAESLSPIDIITPEALQSSGTTELATALSRLVPSLNFPRPAINDGTDASRPAQLRGLAPDQVLVLVNGKRRHVGALVNINGSQGRGSQPVDLNAIPIAAIERVEVLRDGAAAQYGSDAIAGVINIVLKSGSKHGALGADMGQYSAGDGFKGELTGDGGFAFGDRGYIHLAGQLLTQDQTNRARPYLANPALGVTAPVDPANTSPVVQRLGDPSINQSAISFNSEYKLSDAITLYSFGMASNRDSLSNGFFRTGNNSRNLIAIYPHGFLPQEDIYLKDRSLVAGIKGRTENGWNWDLSYDYGNNHWAMNVLNSENQSLGPATPKNFYIGDLETTLNVLNADVSRDFDFGWHSPVTLAFGAEYREDKFNQGPGEYASYVNGGYIVPPPNGNGKTSAGVPGAQVFPGFKPGDSGHYDRNNYSFYADAETSLSDKFSAGAAARYEHFSDFGSTTSGKLSGRYAFTDTVALRGTVSTGFRAPSLAQQFFQATSTNIISGTAYDVRTFAVTNPVAIALGAEPLKPEKSTNYSLGLVMQPADGLNITVDAYQIKIKNRILLSGNLVAANPTNPNDPLIQYLNSQGYFGVTGGRFFTNAVNTKTKGIDIIGSYRMDLGSGTLDLTSSFNYNKTDITKTEPNPSNLPPGVVLTRLDHAQVGLLTCGSPKTKFNLGGTYSVSKFSFTANTTRYGDVCNLNNAVTYTDATTGLKHTVTPDQTIKAAWTLDISATYHMTERLDFTLGADNVTNKYPVQALYLNSTQGQIPYSGLSPYGFNGAYVYGRATFRW